MKRQERADHENIAMGEIDHADNAVDHRVANRDQAINHAQRQPVDQLLQRIRQVPSPYTLRRLVAARSCNTELSCGYKHVGGSRARRP